MFTDTEVGLAFGFRRNLDRVTENAQVLIDGKNAEINLLMSALKKARAELADERAMRMAAELRLERMEEILDTPID
ncbi:hypothetical protein GCM10007989_25470 [Devosia pacifica]|uniref:Uncharacterized protein n=1 Tax=Devosia pacifica TaxID=1335967 RepID=A0A918VV22_9HYPH|nr:hypothetical protein [Devosia pacifica]GHA28324.1 hypothetical protein GCM10007989_25470 [Devosia pacifica]